MFHSRANCYGIIYSLCVDCYLFKHFLLNILSFNMKWRMLNTESLTGIESLRVNVGQIRTPGRGANVALN